jgi:hypothetical protein
VANKSATLYISTKLPSGRWTVKSLPRKPVDLQPPSYFRLFWYSQEKKQSKNVGRSLEAAQATKIRKEAELKRLPMLADKRPVSLKCESPDDGGFNSSHWELLDAAVTKVLDCL